MGVDVRTLNQDEDFRVTVSSFIAWAGLTAGISVLCERRRLERPWYWPWGTPVEVWGDIGAPAIAISGIVFSAGMPNGSPQFLPTTCSSTSRCQLNFTYRSARGLITGIRGSVDVTLFVGQPPVTIATSEGDAGLGV